MPTRYPSLAHRKQAFQRGERRLAQVRAEVAKWPDGIPPREPAPVVTYAPDLLPTLPARVHGIVGEGPWVIQCDGCARVSTHERLILACMGGPFFNAASGDPRRLCMECALASGWRTYTVDQVRESPRDRAFYASRMQPLTDATRNILASRFASAVKALGPRPY